jgi:AraC-like DNA-binding protein
MPPSPKNTFISFEDRASDSSVVERVWRSHSDRAGTFHSMAACNWGIVVGRVAGKTVVTVRGPETKATSADCPADGEWIGIQFKLGTFMPLLPTSTLRDRNDVTLPAASSRSFWLNGSAWEYPTFDNAEAFVSRLMRADLIAADSYVQDVLCGAPRRLSQRTEQRRFLGATGMRPGTIRQIERARHAVTLLRTGAAIADAAQDAGYFDQAHLTRSLKCFTGQTPAQIVRGEQQLSLLYNTDRD